MKISDDELKKINGTQRKKILQYVAEKYGKPEEFSSVCPTLSFQSFYVHS